LRLPALTRAKRGDVIVFIYPDNPKKDFIKRLIGFPGEIVEIKNGTIYINDKPLLGPFFSSRYYYNRGDFAQEGQKIRVPKDSFFVLGDNSSSSQDSRYWGFVPHKNILGKAMLIYWPPTRIRIIK
jgi:signal peptidase I